MYVIRELEEVLTQQREIRLEVWKGRLEGLEVSKIIARLFSRPTRPHPLLTDSRSGKCCAA